MNIHPLILLAIGIALTVIGEIFTLSLIRTFGIVCLIISFIMLFFHLELIIQKGDN